VHVALWRPDQAARSQSCAVGARQLQAVACASFLPPFRLTITSFVHYRQPTLGSAGVGSSCVRGQVCLFRRRGLYSRGQRNSLKSSCRSYHHNEFSHIFSVIEQCYQRCIVTLAATTARGGIITTLTTAAMSTQELAQPSQLFLTQSSDFMSIKECLIC
jgi:hypothetical protein